MEDFSIVVILAVLVVYGVIGVVALASYVVQSLALYKLSKGRNIPNAFLAWVPVGCNWVIGKITEAIDEKRNIKRKWATILLMLPIIIIAIYTIAYIGFFIMMFAAAFGEETMAAAILVIVCMVVFYAVIFIAAMIAMATMACQYICIYKIYEDIVPEKAVKYLLLHCMVPLAGPILLLKCSKIDAVPTFEAIEEKTEEITE